MPSDRSVADWYDANAEQFAAHVLDPGDAVFHWHYEKPAMYALLPELAGKDALSLGCGSGEDSHHLKEAGAARSVGIDISEKLIAIARDRYPDCEFQVMDMERLDFPDASFDFAYSSLALHYLKDWSLALHEVFRVLRPGGSFLFSAWHPLYTAMEKTVNTDAEKIIELSLRTDRTTGTVTVTGDYLTRRERPESLRSADISVWHRPLGESMEAILSAGFAIERFVEPRPLESMREASPRDYQKLSKVPYFMVFRLRKPKD